MATFKPIIERLRADGTYAVRVRVTHNQTLAYIPTGMYVAKQFVRKSKRTGLTITDHRILDKLDRLIRDWRQTCNENDIRDLDAKGVVALIKAVRTDDVMNMDFANWVRQDAERLKKNGQAGTANNRLTAINAFCRVLNLQTIPLSSLTRKLVRTALNAFKGNRAPTLYRAQLRASYNTLMKEYNEDAPVIPANPFVGIDLPREQPPRKRALSPSQIKVIAALPYREITERNKGARFNLAKDVFILSFLLVGMNAVDLYNCTSYIGGRITYERTKTRTRRADKALMSVKVPDIAVPILNKYLDKDGDRVFKFWRMYADNYTFDAALNKGLKQVGKAIGVKDLTFYAARHSWATIAVNDCGIDKWTVHLALNHVDPSTAVTDIYIKKSWKPVDDANKKVIKKVFGRSGLCLPTTKDH